MVDGSCHGVRRTQEGPGQAQNGVEMLMHRAWVTHHYCPLALQQSVRGGAGISVTEKSSSTYGGFTVTFSIGPIEWNIGIVKYGPNI